MLCVRNGKLVQVPVEFTDDECLSEAKGLSEFGKFMHLVDDGREILLAVMSFVIADNTFRALEIICRGNNWQKIASASAWIFHSAEYVLSRQIDLRVLKARGYDRLRGLVATCVADLLACDSRLPDGYSRLANRLFTSQGLQTP